MRLKWALLLVFFISIWTKDFIIVRWEDQPPGLTSVLCTVTDQFGNSTTLYLEQFTWPDPHEPWGEWRAYYPFYGRSWFANCRGYLNQLPHTDTASGFENFPAYSQIHLPFMRK